MARDLSTVTHGIKFPDQGSNLGPLHWECGILATGPPGKSQCGPLLKSLLSLLLYCFCFRFWFLGLEAREILVPPLRMELTPPALEGKVNPWTAREVPRFPYSYEGAGDTRFGP